MKNLLPHGHTYPDGAVYFGCWKDGHWHAGTYTHKNGNKYKGEWKGDFTPKPGANMKRNGQDWSGSEYEVKNGCQIM